MKCNSSIFVGWQAVILAIAFILCALPEPVYCETDSTILLLQQSPAQCGTITPAVGVHYFELNTYVTLTAVPEQGYQFVYWLGDVSDPTANSTITYLDAPKIINAVFQRNEYEFSIIGGESAYGSGGTAGGGLFSGAADYQRQGFGGPGGRRPHKPRWVIPEPATVVLLVLGSLFAFTTGRRKRLTCTKSSIKS